MVCTCRPAGTRQRCSSAAAMACTVSGAAALPAFGNSAVQEQPCRAACPGADLDARDDVLLLEDLDQEGLFGGLLVQRLLKQDLQGHRDALPACRALRYIQAC